MFQYSLYILACGVRKKNTLTVFKYYEISSWIYVYFKYLMPGFNDNIKVFGKKKDRINGYTFFFKIRNYSIKIYYYLW